MSEKIEIKIIKDPVIAKGLYANEIIVQVQEREIVLDFINVIPFGAEAYLVSRISLNHIKANELIAVLQQQIEQFQSNKFGYQLKDSTPFHPDGQESSSTPEA